MVRFFSLQQFFVSATLILMSLAQENFAQTISISGKVTDANDAALSGATVKLVQAGISDTTETDGTFQITRMVSPIISNNQVAPQSFSATIQKGRLLIKIPKSSDVSIRGFSLQGATFSTARYRLNAGDHDLYLSSGKPGVNFYTIKSNEREVTLKVINTQGIMKSISLPAKNSTSSSTVSEKMAKSAVFSDTLTVTKSGYKTYTMPITETEKSGIAIKMEVGGISDALMAYWKFDEAGENDISIDASGNGFNGTPKTPIPRGEGKFGPHSLSLTCPEVMTLPQTMPIPTWPMSISAWVRPHVIEARMYIFTYLPNTTESHHEYEHLLFIEKGVEVRFFMYGYDVKGGTKEKWGLVSPNKLNANEWVHLAVTIGESSGGTPEVPSGRAGVVPTTWRLYENGELTDEGVFNFPPFQEKGEWAIGAKPMNSEYCMNGDIDELMIFNKQLTAEEVKALMTNSLP